MQLNASRADSGGAIKDFFTVCIDEDACADRRQTKGRVNRSRLTLGNAPRALFVEVQADGIRADLGGEEGVVGRSDAADFDLEHHWKGKRGGSLGLERSQRRPLGTRNGGRKLVKAILIIEKRRAFEFAGCAVDNGNEGLSEGGALARLAVCGVRKPSRNG
jgi:hypothetical protein